MMMGAVGKGSGSCFALFFAEAGTKLFGNFEDGMNRTSEPRIQMMRSFSKQTILILFTCVPDTPLISFLPVCLCFLLAQFSLPLVMQPHPHFFFISLMIQ